MPNDVGAARKREGHGVNIPGSAKEMKLVLGSHAQLAQARSQLEDKSLVVLVGYKLEPSKLEELPRLFNLLDLAIHVLLDLLGFLMELDELAGADSLVVGIDASASADNVEDCVHVIDGTSDEAILGLDMTAGDGLASNLFVTRSFDGERRLVHLLKGHQPHGVIHSGGLKVGELEAEGDFRRRARGKDNGGRRRGDRRRDG